jgi:hypothetical protein
MAQDPRREEAHRQWAQVVARAWSDDAFKQRLLTDPQAVLAEAGLPVPANLQVQVHEATPTHLHIVLPPPPPAELRAKLSDVELDQVAGGIDWGEPIDYIRSIIRAWCILYDQGNAP